MLHLYLSLATWPADRRDTCSTRVPLSTTWPPENIYFGGKGHTQELPINMQPPHDLCQNLGSAHNADRSAASLPHPPAIPTALLAGGFSAGVQCARPGTVLHHSPLRPGVPPQPHLCQRVAFPLRRSQGRARFFSLFHWLAFPKGQQKPAADRGRGGVTRANQSVLCENTKSASCTKGVSLHAQLR